MFDQNSSGVLGRRKKKTPKKPKGVGGEWGRHNSVNYDYHLHYCPTASWGAVLGLGSVLCSTLIPCGRVLLYDKCFLLCCTSLVLMFSCKSFPWEEVKSQANDFSSMAQFFAWQKKYLSYDKVETFFTVVSCLGIRDIKSPLQKLFKSH